MQDAGPEHSLKRYCTNARQLKIEAVDPATLLKRLYDSTDSALPVGARLGNSHFWFSTKTGLSIYTAMERFFLCDELPSFCNHFLTLRIPNRSID